MLRAVDADVMDAGADDEAQHAAAMVERTAVARVHGCVDAISAGDEVERRHDESHASVGVEMLRHQPFKISVRAVNTLAIGMINADAEHEVVLRDSDFDVHLDGDRASGAEGDQLAVFVVGESYALEHDLARAPPLLPASRSGGGVDD